MWSLTKQNRYAISVKHNRSSLFEKNLYVPNDYYSCLATILSIIFQYVYEVKFTGSCKDTMK